MNVQTSTAQQRTGNDVAPRSRRKRTLLLALVVLAGAGAAALYWRISRQGVAAGEWMVSRNIEAHQSLVSFKDVTSRIVELPFDEGQWVEKGQLLARVDDSNYRQQVAVDEAAVQVQQQQLASARQNLLAAQHTVANDQADFAEKSTDYQRYQELWKENATSAQSRDLAATAMKQSASSLKRDQAMVGVAEENIAAAAAAVKNAQETLRLAKITLGYTVLSAPFSGVIVVRQTELGEVMQPGTPVVTLADLDHVWLRAYVSETELGKNRLGELATVQTDTYPGKRYQGRGSFISTNPELTPKSVETHQQRVTLVYRIKSDVENPNHELKPGMPADAMVQLRGGTVGDEANGPTLHH